MHKKMKICFAASTGGHFEQLMMLKPLMNKYNSFILTEKTNYKVTTGELKTYFLKQTNRHEINVILNMFINTVKSIYIYLKEKPDVIICTGVLSMIPMCLLIKLFRKKLIYIESFAKINTPTISGKFLYKFADEFYVQWQPMLKVFPNAKYLGGIY